MQTIITKPLFNKKKINFIRDEREGFLTIMHYTKMQNINILNNSAKEIAELCNGNNTLEDIIYLMKKK